MPLGTVYRRVIRAAPRARGGNAAFAWAVAAVLGGGVACDFFEELESAESAEGTGSTGEATDTEPTTTTSATDGDDSCVFPDDDRCLDQDRLQACDPQSGAETNWDCGEICGANLNFTCLGVGAGYHGCWCVAQGKQKVLSCNELEGCLRGCETSPDGRCADQCFTRTTSSTIRMLGALVHCAHDSCHDICIEAPQQCSVCIQSGIDDGAGPCALERSVCDADQNDEPGWP
jgi:hypothetical protein